MLHLVQELTASSFAGPHPRLPAIRGDAVVRAGGRAVPDLRSRRCHRPRPGLDHRAPASGAAGAVDRGLMTFSLAARCARTGMMGAVITTSSPAVGSRCAFARAAIGVVLTQFWTDPRLGPRGLHLLAEGCGADRALAGVVASTPDHQWRQLAVLDATGQGAHYTGARNKPAHAAATGPDCVRHRQHPAQSTRCRRPWWRRSRRTPMRPCRIGCSPRWTQGTVRAGRKSRWFRPRCWWSATCRSRTSTCGVDAAADPLGELRRLWHLYAPFADTVVGRALALGRDRRLRLTRIEKEPAPC